MTDQYLIRASRKTVADAVKSTPRKRAPSKKAIESKSNEMPLRGILKNATATANRNDVDGSGMGEVSPVDDASDSLTVWFFPLSILLLIQDCRFGRTVFPMFKPPDLGKNL